MHQQQVTFKIIIAGDYACGKTSILERYTENQFNKNQEATIASDFSEKALFTDDKQLKIKLHMWDTAGQERFSKVITQFYRGASGVVIVCDGTRYDTIENVQRWLDNVREGSLLETPITSVLCVNKMDKVANTDNIKKIVGNVLKYSENGFSGLFFTSAKSGYGIEEAFQCLIDEMVHKQKNNGGFDILNNEQNITLFDDNNQNKNCIC